MAQVIHKVKSILGGQTPTLYFRTEGQFQSSLGIDPDIGLPGNPFSLKQTGAIAPTNYTEFSGAAVDDATMWLITNPRNALIYAYLSDGLSATNSGALISYSESFASETDIGTPTSGSGDGAAYYNNYIYLATPTDISRYGPLTQGAGPNIINAIWTAGTPLTATGGGLNLTTLTDTTYPTYQSIPWPNHSMHVHLDGVLYFCDVSNGQGIINKISTTISSGIEGAVDSTTIASAYNVLDLPFGYLPTDIASYGLDLAIVASQMDNTNTTLIPGKSAMFLWDTFSSTFYQQIPIDYPFTTAIHNRNGQLHIFSGMGGDDRGFVVSKYLGGYSWQEIDFFEEGHPPYAGGVDAFGGRMVFGSAVTDPATAGTVHSLGYKNPKLPRNARHSMARISGSGASPVVSSVKYLQQASGSFPRVVIGWKDGSAQGIDNLGGTPNSIFRTELFTVDRPFVIDRIRIPLSEAVGANTTIGVVIHYDRGTTTKTLNTINNTNFTKSERVINFKAQEIEQATTAGYQAQHDYFINFTLTGSDDCIILLPIEIYITTTEDD